MTQSSVTVENGWALYAHPFFIQRLSDLISAVHKVMQNDPHGFHHHPAYKFFDAVAKNITQNVPADPAHPCYRLGGTLGRRHQHWRRVKKHQLPDRYRLFFLFRTDAPKTIIYAWLNDESTVRREGSRSDVYVVFQKMLDSGRVPSGFPDLLAKSQGLGPEWKKATGTEEESL